MHRILTAVAAAAALALTLTGCTGAASEPIAVTEDMTVIDVRTAQEYAQGHLDGAVSLDVTGGELAAAIPSLDPEAEYLVYCRSGNRSAQAVRQLEDAGFTAVTALGSMTEAAEATGIAVVR